MTKRIDDAYSLMNDILSTKPSIDSKRSSTPSASPRALTRSTSLESLRQAKNEVQSGGESSNLDTRQRRPSVTYRKGLPPKGSPTLKSKNDPQRKHDKMVRSVQQGSRGGRDASGKDVLRECRSDPLLTQNDLLGSRKCPKRRLSGTYTKLDNGIKPGRC